MIRESIGGPGQPTVPSDCLRLMYVDHVEFT
jgi:hypothetical protein